MRVLLLVLALAPSGFTEHPELASRVQFVAGKPVHVYCADTDAAWLQAISDRSAPDGPGFAQVGGDSLYLIQSTCRQLLLKVAGQTFAWYRFTSSLLTLTHEAEHLTGLRDEHDTDCAALANVRQVATNFGIRKPRNLDRVQTYAAIVHAGKPAAYSAAC